MLFCAPSTERWRRRGRDWLACIVGRDAFALGTGTEDTQRTSVCLAGTSHSETGYPDTWGEVSDLAWWRHRMETFSALLAICAGNSLVTGEFLAQRPVARSFDVFFDLRLNKRLSKQSWGWWFETLSRPVWVTVMSKYRKPLAIGSTAFKTKAVRATIARNIWLNYEGRRPEFATTRKRLWRVRAPRTSATTDSLKG